MHIDSSIKLHKALRVTYVVDSYVAELIARDGDVVTVSARGETVAIAIENLQREMSAKIRAAIETT